MTPEILAKLGLPPTWAPGPVSWALAKLTPAAGGTAANTHVLVLNTSAGRIAVAFTDDELRPLVDEMTKNLTGIAIARKLAPFSDDGGSGAGRNGGLHSA